MTLAQIIPLALEISIGLVVFALALQTKKGDLAYLLGRPRLLLRSMLSMNVVMPVLAAAIAALFQLRNELEVALILLAVSPVPPILPEKQIKAGGNFSYGTSLMAVSALVAIVVAPASVALIGRFFGRTVYVSPGVIAFTVATSVLGPLLIGATIRLLVPSAVRMAKGIARFGTVVLVLAFTVVLAGSWRAIVAEIGNFTVVAIVLFGLVSLAVGHLLGGPDHDDRTVLALSTANRHPGVAIAIASLVARDKAAVAAAVLLASLVTAIATVPYAKWRKRSHSAIATSSA